MDIRTQQRLDEIGARFISSALTQLDEVRTLASRIHDGDYTALAELERLTHQLHGSAAMFRFDGVSQKAGKINSLLKSFDTDPDKWKLGLLDGLLIDMSDAIHDAAASRNRRRPARGTGSVAAAASA